MLGKTQAPMLRLKIMLKIILSSWGVILLLTENVHEMTYSILVSG